MTHGEHCTLVAKRVIHHNWDFPTRKIATPINPEGNSPCGILWRSGAIMCIDDSYSLFAEQCHPQLPIHAYKYHYT